MRMDPTPRPPADRLRGRTAYLETGSYAAASRATGIPTATLHRWGQREAWAVLRRGVAARTVVALAVAEQADGTMASRHIALALALQDRGAALLASDELAATAVRAIVAGCRLEREAVERGGADRDPFTAWELVMNAYASAASPEAFAVEVSTALLDRDHGPLVANGGSSETTGEARRLVVAALEGWRDADRGGLGATEQGTLSRHDAAIAEVLFAAHLHDA